MPGSSLLAFGDTMARIDIWTLDITDDRADHMWERHGVDADSVRALMDSPYVVVANRNLRAASHPLIGADPRGRCLTVPVRHTGDPHSWEAITAWPCSRREAAGRARKERLYVWHKGNRHSRSERL